jgi:hypothetical protein
VEVIDPRALGNGNTSSATPGVVFINGEKITYYRNFGHVNPVRWRANLNIAENSVISYQNNVYVTLGNVYARNFAAITGNLEQVHNANVLTQIRRAVDGTAPQIMHPAGSLVVDAGVREFMASAQTSNIVLGSDTVYTPTANISYALTLTAPITANIGDYLAQVDPTVLTYTAEGYDTLGLDKQKFDETIPPASLTAHMRVLESVQNSLVVPVIVTSGVLQTLPEVFDSDLGFDVEGFDNTGFALYVNGFNSGSDVRTITRLGQVNNLGQVAVAANTKLTTSQVWYNTSTGIIPVNGFSTNYPASITDLVYNMTISLKLSVNAGDAITFFDPTNLAHAPVTVLRVLESSANSLIIPVLIESGTPQTLIETFDISLGFDYAGFDNINPPYYMYVNGKQTNIRAISFKPIGTLGQVQGPVAPSNGQGLFNSTTTQADFLKASLAYMP